MPERRSSIRFGVFEANLETGELRRKGVRIKIQDQPFQVLAALLERPGEIVTKEQLQERIWSEETFVDFDRSLATAVNKVRHALGDSAANSRFIETVPKRGYRFIYPLDSEPRTPSELDHARPRRVALAAGALLVPAALAYWSYARLSQDAAIGQATSITPLTHYSGAEIQPSFSPSGDRIAFAWDSGQRPGQFDIYVQVVGESNAQALTSDPRSETDPSWSPDGRHIAFFRGQEAGGEWRQDILLIPATGGPEVVLNRSPIRTNWGSRGRGLAWTPDGRSVIFADRTDRGDTQAIFALDVSSRERFQITRPYDGEMDLTPAVSPDGRSMLFSRGRGVAAEVFEVALGDDFRPTGPPRQLTHDPEYLNWNATFWNSSIVHERRGFFAKHAQIRAVGSNVGPLVRGVDPASSVANDRLAFTVMEQPVGLWRSRLDERHRSTGNPQRIISSTGADIWSRYSPDGKRIAFQSDRAGENVLWISDADGANTRKLTRQGADGTPSWSPDGKTIVFDSIRTGRLELFTVDVEGGPPKPLQTVGGAAAWSGDGGWIYYENNSQIWRLRPDGSNREQLTSRGGRRPKPGRGDGYVYYFNPERGGIWRVPSAGGEEETVIPDTVATDCYETATGGIYYATSRGPATPYEVQFWDAASGESQPVGIAVPRMGWRQMRIGLSLSPDERWLLFQRPEPLRADIMLAEGFD